jgi:hypothetical protein
MALWYRLNLRLAQTTSLHQVLPFLPTPLGHKLKVQQGSNIGNQPKKPWSFPSLNPPNGKGNHGTEKAINLLHGDARYLSTRFL